MAIEPSPTRNSPQQPNHLIPTPDQTNNTMLSTLNPAPTDGAVDSITTPTITNQVSAEITTKPASSEATIPQELPTSHEEASDDESVTESTSTRKLQEPALALQWNLCGLSTRGTELELLRSEFRPAVIALQEVQTRQARQKLENSGYEWEFAYPPGEVSKNGAALGVQKGIPHNFVQLDTNLQAVAAAVEWPIRATFVSVYVCKKDGRKTLKDELQKLCDQLPLPVILLGDFNAHSDLWGSGHLDDRGKAIEEFLSDSNLIVLNTGDHTRIDPHDGKTSAIDLSIASEYLARRLRWEVIDDNHGSDHFPIVVRDIDKLTRPEQKSQRWKYDVADWKKFQEGLSPPSVVCVEAFEAAIVPAAESSIPRTSKKVSHRRVHWWNESVAKAIKTRRKTLRRAKKLHKDDPRRVEVAKAFRAARWEARNATKAAKTQSWTAFATGISPGLCNKEVWRRLNLLRNGNTPTVKRLETPSGITDDPVEMANILAEQFYQVSADASLHPEHLQKRKETNTSVDHSKHDSDFYNVDFSLAELRWAISRGKGLSDGVDRIGYPMLRHLPESMEEYLLELLNVTWRSGRIPDRWKEGLVIAIPKANKDSTQPANLRPITLVSCVGKTLERMVNRRLVQLLESKGVFGPEQHGFRSGHGVDTYLAELEEEMEASIQKGMHTELVLLDLTKAYDTAWRAPILTNLAKWGIGGNMGRYVESFLANRTFRVTVGGALSALRVLENGVPQGTVMAVTAFLVRMTEVKAFIPAGVRMKLYADDILLSTTGWKAGDVRKKAQKAVQAVEAWAVLYGFQLSAAKSELLHVCRKNSHQDQPDISTEEDSIETVKSARLLGVHMDSRLRFWKHIENAKRSVASSNRALGVIGGHLVAGARTTLLMAQRAIVQSKIFFGWGLISGASDSRRNRLEAAYNAGIRTASGAFKSSPVLAVMAEAGVLPYKYAETLALISKAAQIQALTEPGSNRTVYTRACERFNRITGLDLPDIEHVLRTTDRPWNSPTPKVDWSMHSLVRAGDSAAKVAAAFGEVVERYRGDRAVYTDGSLKDDVVGSGFVDGATRISYRLPEQCSVFSAEAFAIRECLVKTAGEERRTVIYSDSFSVLAAVEGGFSKHPWVQQIEALMQNREVVLVWIPGHAGIAGNDLADEAAKTAHQLEPVDGPVPKQDVLRWAQEKIEATWDREWYGTRDLHLRRIKSTTAAGKDRPDQEEQRALTRLRIGHTRITHSESFKTGAKMCETCGLPQTVEHILLQCRRFNAARTKHAIDPNLGIALANTLVEENKMVAFLREAGIFREI